MNKQAKGIERFFEEEDRQRVEPAREAQPNPAATKGLLRSAPPISTAGTLKLLAAYHAISLSLSLTLLVWSVVTDFSYGVSWSGQSLDFSQFPLLSFFFCSFPYMPFHRFWAGIGLKGLLGFWAHSFCELG